MNTNDYSILSIYIIFGFLIIVGYSIMIKKYAGDSTDIWTNKGNNNIYKIKIPYILMILFSFIAGIYLIYYFTVVSKNETDKILIYTGSIILLVFSVVWAFFPFYYNKIILAMVAFGAILILAGICVNSESNDSPKKIIAIIASILLVIQTLLDAIIWTGLIMI